ncbi:MAG: non-heme iron oxygenase ferredoxin subunit [Acidimicrobiia bacterium]|nr:non-heme iron oxygenase ferredoxin subunit [Actinomycetota bacterium]MBL6924921.1 non-heme iron oxygenase ferredoxin subunit [Acidimicrobiia bacterium]MBL6927152.1 non-heme iron oxygenase ferredoxin subunit [Acidimicrobiia bacterium]
MSSVRVCSLADLPDGTARKVDVDGEPVALVRIGERIMAVADTCSHAEVSLSEGEVVVDECAIECWKHGSLFSLETGEALTLPATQPVIVFTARIEGDDIMVDER